MTSRDLAIIGVGTVLAVIGIAASFLGIEKLGLTALFLLGLLVLFLLVLQRRHQSRVQERILYLINAEKKREKNIIQKPVPGSADESNVVFAKKIIGILQAQQISIERLRSEINDDRK